MIFIELTRRGGAVVRLNAMSITAIESLPDYTLVATMIDTYRVRQSPDQIEELIEQAEDAYNRKVLDLSIDVATSGAFDCVAKAVGLE
ncbi:flagellar FlbD family protein [Nocardia aobensis]|uniref:Flagellar FlbD family protein n=1 Tax=Nocardia aobensis TaxID=257277 RepID=A0ABW6P5P0_9NOCA